MRSVLRLRHYCDFCKKAGGSSFHMKRHEASCTLNPDRRCKMCEARAGYQEAMASLVAALPDPAQFQRKTDWGDETTLDDAKILPLVAEGLKDLRRLTDGCPVCIMAAFRQRGIPIPLAEDFNFTKELAAEWVEINSAREDERPY